jgi:hypothetical protein
MRDYEAMLTEARLDIRIKEDITDEVYGIITGSWARFLSSLKGKRVDKDTSRRSRRRSSCGPAGPGRSMPAPSGSAASTPSRKRR